MAELSENEFWLIRVYFEKRGFGIGHSISDITWYMMKHSCYDSENIIHSLIEKKVLGLSPNGAKIKFTDYGLELYNSVVKEQKEWEEQKIIKVSNIEHDQILIRSGETFKADRVIREVLSLAEKELCILDAYIGSSLFDLLENSNTRASIRIVTSDKTKRVAITSYKAYKQQYSNIEMRISEYEKAKFHDRFILWDKSRGIHSGHSFKDLGGRDAQLDLIDNAEEQIALFEERWAEANPV